MLEPRTVAAAAIALLPAIAWATEPPAAVPPTYGEVVDVRVVTVEAKVTDRAGQPVRGLTAADFRLLVDGRQVTIDHFDEVLEGRPASAPGGSEQPEQSTVTGPTTLGRNFLVFVDDSFAVSSVRNVALTAVANDLATLSAGDRMAIVAFDGLRLEELSPWSSDGRALAAALAAAARRPANGHALIAGAREMESDVELTVDATTAGTVMQYTPEEVSFLLDALHSRAHPQAEAQLTRTTEAMASALRGFDAPPGRKVLLLLTGGWSASVSPRLFGPFLEAANLRGYTVYPVDAAVGGAFGGASLGNIYDSLARATGGRMVGVSGGALLAAVARDSGTYYLLGFDANFRADDLVHRIAVKVRRPLRVRARSSYSDVSARTETAMRAEGVLLFGGAAADRRLVVELGASKPVGRRNREVELEVTLGVPVDALAFVPDSAGGYAAEVPLAVSALDDEGGRADRTPSRLRVATQQPPATGLARFHTTIRVRRAPQRVVFSVRAADGRFLWGETQLAF